MWRIKESHFVLHVSCKSILKYKQFLKDHVTTYLPTVLTIASPLQVAVDIFHADADLL